MKTNTTRATNAVATSTMRRHSRHQSEPRRRNRRPSYWYELSQIPEPGRRAIADDLEREVARIRATCTPDPWTRLDSGGTETVIQFEFDGDHTLEQRLLKRGSDYLLAVGDRSTAPRIRPISLKDSVRWFARTNLRAVGYNSTPRRFSAWLSAALLDAGKSDPRQTVAR